MGHGERSSDQGRLRYLVYALLLLAICAVPALALASGEEANGVQPYADLDDPRNEPLRQQAQAQYEAERQARQATPAERQRSRTAYADLTSAEALAVAREGHPEVVLAAPFLYPELAPGQAIERYAG